MSYYVFNSRLTYPDFLQGKSFVDDLTSSNDRIAMHVSKQTREVVASVEDCTQRGISCIEGLAERSMEHQSALIDSMTNSINSVLSAGFERLSYNLKDISGELANVSTGIAELKASFDWGFSNIIAELGGMNDSIKELIKIAASPAQTPALEHFATARDMFRQGIYTDVLEELDKAINGVPGVSAGYKQEWRIHHLKGVVKLGFVDCDFTLVNLPEAEDAFLTAALYAKTDHPKDAANAFLSAGWAAYCQGKMPEALMHTEKAIQLNPLLGEALFQMAKILMAQNQVIQALPVLRKAIDTDLFYSLKAIGDGDFQIHEIELRSFLASLGKEKYHKLTELALSLAKDIVIDRSELDTVIAWINRKKTLLGYPDAEVRLEQFKRKLKDYIFELDFLNMVKRASDIYHKDIRSLLTDSQKYDMRVQNLTNTEIHLTGKGSTLLHDAQELFMEIVYAIPVVITIEQKIAYKVSVVDRPKSIFKSELSHQEIRFRYEKKEIFNPSKRKITKQIYDLVFPFDCLYIEGGTFNMGSNEGDRDEKPVHQVSVSFFYLGKYLVTQKEWQDVMGSNPSRWKGNDLPVEKVSWNDAVDYCNKRSIKEGLKPCYSGSEENPDCDWKANGYRLPTEAEWEYAARGGNKSKGYKYSGANDIDVVAWYDGNSGGGTHVVGSKDPNELGIFDMSGDVWEWCWDWYSSSPSSNPNGTASGSGRVVRGGDWNADASDCRVANRFFNSPISSSGHLGFRLCRASL